MMYRKDFAEARHFAFYYGPRAVEELASYDVVVIEPSLYTAMDIKRLQQQKTIALAYVSVMEINQSHPHWPSVWQEDLLIQHGIPLRQNTYDNEIIDLSSTHWRNFLLNYIGGLLMQGHYQGVFLDTIGDVEMSELVDPVRQIDAAITLVKQLRQWFPDYVIVQNNGLEVLCLHTAPYVDGIVWENPPIGIKASLSWVEQINERLNRLRLENQLQVFILFDGCESISKYERIERQRFADIHQYLVYCAPRHYQKINRRE
ncbi:MAG: endo alpha-1,4 polygalactosaminidase [Acidibacillus sp.]|nr:endo alpha-1,4 polygalactosaminidase [Acidibacillus sp.]